MQILCQNARILVNDGTPNIYIKSYKNRGYFWLKHFFLTKNMDFIAYFYRCMKNTKQIYNKYI